MGKGQGFRHIPAERATESPREYLHAFFRALWIEYMDPDDVLPMLECCRDGLGKTVDLGRVALVEFDTIDNDPGVDDAFRKDIREIVDTVVYQISHKPFLPDEIPEVQARFEGLAYLRADTDPGAFFERSEIVHDILMGLLGHRRAIVRTDTCAETQEKEPVEIIDLRDGAYRRTGIMGHRLLFDADRRCQPAYLTHLGFFRHASDEHPSIGRERFEITALPLVAERREGQR